MAKKLSASPDGGEPKSIPNRDEEAVFLSHINKLRVQEAKKAVAKAALDVEAQALTDLFRTAKADGFSRKELQAKRLWLENKSASNIARLMGPTWTRNMVIGMVHRHGLSEGRKTNAKPGAAAKTAKVKPVREPRPPKPLKPAKDTPSQPFDLSKSKTDSTAEQRAEKAAAGRLIIKRTIDAANDNSVPMVGRSFGQCAWPVGTPARAADQLACGAPIYQGIEKCSYCLDHAQRAFARDITQPKPKENLERANRRWAA